MFPVGFALFPYIGRKAILSFSAKITLGSVPSGRKERVEREREGRGFLVRRREEEEEILQFILSRGSLFLNGKMMEFEVVDDSEQLPMRGSSLGPIDPRKARFPCCIVWTPLPLISWLVPFIGHIGICKEDGVILDFAGPHFVSVDHFTFGAVTRYIQLSSEKRPLSSNLVVSAKNIVPEGDKFMTWDDALRKSTQDYQHRSYSLFTCNCHCFVANCLNRLSYGGHSRWNVVNLAALMFFRGTWVNKIAVVKSLLPFAIVLCLGLLLGGTNFLIFLGLFALVLVGWFLIGTYCFKNLVQL